MMDAAAMRLVLERRAGPSVPAVMLRPRQYGSRKTGKEIWD